MVTSGLGTSALRLATARARYGAVSNSSEARSASGAVPCIGQRNSLPAATIWGSESWARIMFPPRPGSPLGKPTFPRWTAHPPTLASIVQEAVGECEVVHTWKKRAGGRAGRLVAFGRGKYRATRHRGKLWASEWGRIGSPGTVQAPGVF